jgi:hypothetical protein
VRFVFYPHFRPSQIPIFRFESPFPQFFVSQTPPQIYSIHHRHSNVALMANDSSKHPVFNHLHPEY